MKYFYDLEFIEGKPTIKSYPTIQLISIGIVREDKEKYTALCSDFDLELAFYRNDGTETNPNYWLRENVLFKLFPFDDTLQKLILNYQIFSTKSEIDNLTNDIYQRLYKLLKEFGKSEQIIKQEIIEFFRNDSDIKLYGYYSAYDHVRFCWIFGKMIDLPHGFPMYTIDLKQELDSLICKRLEHNDLYSKYNFEKVLELVKKFSDYPKQYNEHSALSDAKWNYELYKFIEKLSKLGKLVIYELFKLNTLKNE